MENITMEWDAMVFSTKAVEAAFAWALSSDSDEDTNQVEEEQTIKRKKNDKAVGDFAISM